MSLTAIRPYFKERLKAAGFTEWVDPFNPDGMPNSIADLSFHQAIESIQGVVKENIAQEVEVSVTLRMAFKGYREPDKALDRAILKSQEVVQDLINPKTFMNRTPAIAGVFLDSINFEPLNEDQNDNIVIAVCGITVRLYMCVE